MILFCICAAWAAEPTERRSELRLSAMASVRTEARTWTGEGLDVAVTHQFPVPFVLGIEGAGGVDHGPEYELGDPEYDTAVGPESHIEVSRDPEWTLFGVWLFAGYTVRVQRVDATPVFRLSGEGYVDVTGAVRWWPSDHWALQAQLGPYQLAATADKGLFDLGFGVAWRPRAPHAEK
jgi:hypothetical protein